MKLRQIDDVEWRLEINGEDMVYFHLKKTNKRAIVQMQFLEGADGFERIVQTTSASAEVNAAAGGNVLVTAEDTDKTVLMLVSPKPF